MQVLSCIYGIVFLIFLGFIAYGISPRSFSTFPSSSFFNSGSAAAMYGGGYKLGDEISVSMNKVWPHNSPIETYSYYDKLPVCHPTDISYYSMSFGQIMRGDRLVNSLYQIQFRENKENASICTRKMTAEDLQIFRNAIDNNYMFEIYVADLPIHRPVGLKSHSNTFQLTDEKGVASSRYYLVNHLIFLLGYNDNQVVSANITIGEKYNKDGDSNDRVLQLIDITDIPEDEINIEFTYSVRWENRTDIQKEDRFIKQLTGALTTTTNSLDIHWLAIINSFVLVLLIISLLLIIILRVVRSDLSKFLKIPDEEFASGLEEETGWKLLHADVFRAPPHRMWFCACVGCGAQLFLVVVTLILMGCFAPFVERGAVLSSGLFGYMLTSFISGFLSASIYKKLGGVKWAWNIVVTAMMFMGPVFCIWLILNTVAFAYASTAALPFGTATFLLSCWLFITLPLTVIGGIIGRQSSAMAMKTGNVFPCKVNKLAREIPLVHWYQSPLLQMILCGFLPFSAIYIELHYVFLSVWGNRIYTLYGILLLAFAMLLLVASTVSVLLTYFHLNAEDHRWWWRSFISGGSVALFFYLHCFYYFFTSTRMYGFLQIAFFFGYSLVVAWGLFLIIGFLTFTSVFCFIHYIYTRIKLD